MDLFFVVVMVVSAITTILGIIVFIFVIGEDEHSRTLASFFIFAGITSMIAFSCFTFYGVCTEDYYAVNLTKEQRYEIATMSDSHHLIRSVEIEDNDLVTTFWGNNTATRGEWSDTVKVTFNVRYNDRDNLSRYIKELDFKLYKSENDAKKPICEMLNGQWFDKMNQCLECQK